MFESLVNREFGELFGSLLLLLEMVLNGQQLFVCE
jgi:hypothetical protein